MKLDLNNFDQVMDEAMKGRQGPLDEARATDLMRQMLTRIYERALRGELTHQLGYEKHAVAGHLSGNSRNGTSPKTMKGELGNLVLERAPRSQRRVRAAVNCQASNAAAGFRSENDFDVCAGHEHARYSSPLTGNV